VGTVAEVQARLSRRSAALKRNVYETVERLLSLADVRIDGDRPWDIQVHDEAMYARVLAEGALGLGESYMDGWWDSESVDQFFQHILSATLEAKVRPGSELPSLVKARLLNLQKRTRAYQIGERHYDIGNNLFRRMLDPLMIYSCGYWKDAASLQEAQEAKLDLVCRKLGLQPGMSVLDIGCGWGGTAKFAAERYGVDVVGITISKEQAKLAEDTCRGFPVEIRLQDYREVDETFDRILSIGMFEHVGTKNYRTYMRVVRGSLKDDGLFVLHTIGGNRSVSRTNAWTERYIFPNSVLPTARQIATAIEGLFVLEDWHNFGPDYDKTLMCWFRNFDDAWEELRAPYGDRFYRMWKYFLLSSAGSFRSRAAQLWQIVLAPKGVAGGYRSVR
jgi:cyclopropane-fatty-acyl-phospholipid synthase